MTPREKRQLLLLAQEGLRAIEKLEANKSEWLKPQVGDVLNLTRLLAVMLKVCEFTRDRISQGLPLSGPMHLALLMVRPLVMAQERFDMREIGDNTAGRMEVDIYKRHIDMMGSWGVDAYLAQTEAGYREALEKAVGIPTETQGKSRPVIDAPTVISSPHTTQLALALREKPALAKDMPGFSGIFERTFWTPYLQVSLPTHRGDKQATKSLLAVLTPEELHEAIGSFPAWCAYWRGYIETDRGTFVPRLTTWIKECRWRDTPARFIKKKMPEKVAVRKPPPTTSVKAVRGAPIVVTQQDVEEELTG